MPANLPNTDTLKAFFARARTLLFRVSVLLRTDYWFPHAPLAILFAAGGGWLLWRNLGPHWAEYLKNVATGSHAVSPRLLPVLVVGCGMFLACIGLLFRSRVAWTMAFLLAVAAAAITELGLGQHEYGLLVYFILMLVLLLIAWRSFDRASLAASTLFAFTSVMMLLMYATFGAFYLGSEYKPHIADMVTALYFAVVTMTTVGYGDITPQTPDARLFTLSVIVLGVAIFATSLTAVIAPLVSNSLTRIVSRKDRGMKRSGHFVVIGNTALASNTFRELCKRGRAVVRILRTAPEDGATSDDDLVIGDPSSVDILKQAGADKAEAVLAMTDDDSENAFVVLAVKEMGSTARTVAAVNDAHHMNRIRLVQPDVVIAPQVLGGELMAMMLSGETVTPEFVMERVFQSKPGTA